MASYEEETSEQWNMAFKKLNAIALYKPGWDGENANSIDPQLVEQVLIYLHMIKNANADPPPSMVYADHEGCIFV